MKKPIRMPKESEQHLLDKVSVRLIADEERERYDHLLDEQHLAEYCEDLSRGQLRALGFRRNRKTGRIAHPKETTFFRRLSKTDPKELQQALLACLDSLMGEDKSNEIPAARTLIEDRQLDDAMILTDALHTQGLSAREIVQDCGGDYLMTVKANQKGLLRSIHQTTP